MEKKYAIKIRLGEGDWLYVTEDTGKCMDMKVQLFDTEKDADSFADIWRTPKSTAKVVEYGYQKSWR